MTTIKTPSDIESRLLELDADLARATSALIAAENRYGQAKADAEIALAKHRLSIIDAGSKMTVAEREDRALVACENEVREERIADAVARSMRANVARVRVQIDIARSVGTSVRAALDL